MNSIKVGNLKPATVKVGDRVRVTKAFTQHAVNMTQGREAEVIEINSDIFIGLLFKTKLKNKTDSRIIAGHDCDSKGPEGYCYWIYEENLSKITKVRDK